MSEKCADRRILVTGGNGFLGRHLVTKLRRQGYKVVAPRSRECDLRDRGSVDHWLRKVAPEAVVHLAAVVGGIGANRVNPGRYFYENAIMGINLIDAARIQGVEKLVLVGTVCAYPKYTPAPFREADLWNGYPEETNAPYGLAKRMLLVQLQAYRQQYGCNGIYLIPVNLYGPGDNFDLDTSHVIPAMIRKFATAADAGVATVSLWGSGQASREFLFVKDCADAICLAMQHYDQPEPVNIGTGNEITIADLATQIARLTEFRGTISWDTTAPDGQPRRWLDVRRAEDGFGFKAATSLEDGLRRTLAWWRSHADAVIAAERAGKN